MAKLISITACVDCPNHLVLRDPDPNDWFCRDDVKIVCLKTEKVVTVACRPYNMRKESTPIPFWCPLENSNESE